MNRVRKQLRCYDDIQKSIIEDKIAVAILDTGIGRHPDFENRVVAFADFVNGRLASYDDSGHVQHTDLVPFTVFQHPHQPTVHTFNAPFTVLVQYLADTKPAGGSHPSV